MVKLIKIWENIDLWDRNANVKYLMCSNTKKLK